jgi:coenzyme F420 hydrogenase subunit beta
VDSTELSLAVFGKKPDASLVGNYVGCYIGHSNNESIQRCSSSGGLVTQLLLFCLKHGIIDGTLVTRMNKNVPLEPEVFIARTKEEIIEASRSKYCPVPLNAAIKLLLKEPGRFAVVGLPCHIEGLGKAELRNKELQKKIVLHLGLICNHTPTFQATVYLLKKMKIDPPAVAKIDYRGEGWPGSLSVTLNDGKKKIIAHFDPYYWGHIFNSYFYTKRCFICNDKISRLSDISFGDAWGKSNCALGDSIIVSRTKHAEEILQNAIKENEIALIKATPDDIVYSQALSLIERRQKARVKIFKIFGKKIPIFNENSSKPNCTDYVAAFISFVGLSLCSKQQLWYLLDIFPWLSSLKQKLQKS